MKKQLGRVVGYVGNDQLTLLTLPVLEQLHGLEGRAAGDELVAQLRLVRRAIVDLVTGVLGFVCTGERSQTGLAQAENPGTYGIQTSSLVGSS